MDLMNWTLRIKEFAEVEGLVQLGAAARADKPL
jgi:hypothetical protein